MNKFFGIAGLLALSLVGVLGCNPASSTQSTPAFFYRLKADFVLKETGEPLSFDYVVACDYTEFNNVHTSSTVFSQLTPAMMIKPAGESSALGVVSVDMCENWPWTPIKFSALKGESRIPDEFRPFVIWFDDINDLSRGWGYKSDDAYESPRAKIDFVQGAVERATAVEWRAWRAEAEANYVQKGVLPGPWGFNGDYQVSRSIGEWGLVDPVCPAQAVVELSPEWTERLFAAMPDDVGEYFVLSELTEYDRALYKEFKSITTPIFADGTTGEHYSRTTKTRASELGTSRRSGDGHIRWETGPDGFTHRTYLPILSRSESMPEADGPQDVYYRKILTAPEYEGFGFCSSIWRPIDLLATPERNQLVKLNGGVPAPVFEAEARDKSHRVIVGDVEATGRLPRTHIPISRPVYVVSRDGEFFFPE